MFKQKQHDKPSQLRITSKIMSFLMLLASIAGGLAPAATTISADANTQQVGSSSSSAGSGSNNTKKQEQTSQTSQSDNDSQPVYGGAANVKSDDQTSDAQPNAPNGASQEFTDAMRDLQTNGANSELGKYRQKQMQASGQRKLTTNDAKKIDDDAMDAKTREMYLAAKKQGRLAMSKNNALNVAVPKDMMTGQMFLTKKQTKQLTEIGEKKRAQLKGLHGAALAKKAQQIDYLPTAGMQGKDSYEITKGFNQLNAHRKTSVEADTPKKSTSNTKFAGVIGTVMGPVTNLFKVANVHADTTASSESKADPKADSSSSDDEDTDATDNHGDHSDGTTSGDGHGVVGSIRVTHYFNNSTGALSFVPGYRAGGLPWTLISIDANGFQNMALSEYQASGQLTFCIEPWNHAFGGVGTIRAANTTKDHVKGHDALWNQFKKTMSHDGQGTPSNQAVTEALCLAEAVQAYYTDGMGRLPNTDHDIDAFTRLYAIQHMIWAITDANYGWKMNTAGIKGDQAAFVQKLNELIYPGAAEQQHVMIPANIGMIAAWVGRADNGTDVPTVTIGQEGQIPLKNVVLKKDIEGSFPKRFDKHDYDQITRVTSVKFDGGPMDGQDASDYVDVKIKSDHDHPTNIDSALADRNSIVAKSYAGGYAGAVVVTPKNNFPAESNIKVHIVKNFYKNKIDHPMVYVVDNGAKQWQFHTDYTLPMELEVDFHVIPYRYTSIKAHKTLTMSGTTQAAITHKLGMKSGYSADQIKQLLKKINLEQAVFELQDEHGTPVKWSDPVMTKASVATGSKVAGSDSVQLHPDANGDAAIKSLRSTGNEQPHYKLVEVKTPDHTNRTAKVLDFSIGGPDASTDPNNPTQKSVGEFQDDVHYTGITGKKHENYKGESWYKVGHGNTHLEGAEYTLFYGDNTFGKKDQPVDPSDLAALKLTKSDDSRVRIGGGRITLITDAKGNLPAIDNLLDYDDTSYYLAETKAAKGLHLDNHLYYFGSGAKQGAANCKYGSQYAVALEMTPANTDIQNNTDISASYETDKLDTEDHVKLISDTLEKREEYLGTPSPFEKTHRGSWGSTDGHTQVDFNKVTPYYISNEKPWKGVKNLGSTHKEHAVYGLFYAADSTDGSHKKGQPVKWTDDVAMHSKVTHGTKIAQDYTTGTGKKISAADINIRLGDDDAMAGISDLAYQEYYWKEVEAPAGTALDSKEYIFGANKEQTPTYTQNKKAAVQVDEMETRQDASPSSTDVNSNFHWDNTFLSGKPYGSTNYVVTFGFNSTKGVENSNGQSPLQALKENGVKLTLHPLDGTQGPDISTTTFTRTLRDNNGDTTNVKGYFEFRTVPIGTYYLTSDNSNADKTADGTTDATANMQPMIIKMSRDSDNNNYTLSFYSDTNRNKKFDHRDREVARYSSAHGDFMPTQTTLDNIPNDQMQDGYGAATQPGEDVYEGENHVWSRPSFVDVSSDGARNNNYIAMEANVGKQPFAINDTSHQIEEHISSKASGTNGQVVTVGEVADVSDQVKISLREYPDTKGYQELKDGQKYTMKTIVMKKNKDNPNGTPYQVFYTPFTADRSKLQNVEQHDQNGDKYQTADYYVNVKGKLDTSKLTEDDSLVFYEALLYSDVNKDTDHDKDNIVTDPSINTRLAATAKTGDKLDQLNDSAASIDASGRDAGLKQSLNLDMSVENDINDKDQTLTVEHQGKLHTTAWGSSEKAKALGKTIEADKNQFIRDDIDLTKANLVNGKTYTIDKTVPVLPYKSGIVKDENEPIDFKDLETPVTKMTVVKDAHGNKAIALPFKDVKVLRDSDAGSLTEPSGKQTDTVLKDNQFTYHKDMKTVSVLISGVDLSKYESGQKVVMFEDVAGQGIKPMIHADINDQDQTVTVKPKLHTNFENATVPGGAEDITKVERSKIKYSKFYIPGKKVTLVDKVTFNGVKVGQKQTISGTVMTVDSNGKPVEYKDANGKPVKASVTFTPKTPNGTIDIPFTFVTNPKAITKLVAYESGKYEGEDQPYAVHEDINDQGQTVKPRKPKIATQAHTDTGKTFKKTTSTKMYDNIQMNNLNAGDSYKMQMKLWRVPGGDTKNAQVVYASNKDFVANTDDEKAAINTIVDTSQDTPGTYYVWTEDLLDSKKPNNVLATHDDLNNKDQTVTLQDTPEQSVPGNTPFSQTGQTALWSLLILGAGAIAVGIYYERKRRQHLD